MDPEKFGKMIKEKQEKLKQMKEKDPEGYKKLIKNGWKNGRDRARSSDVDKALGANGKTGGQ